MKLKGMRAYLVKNISKSDLLFSFLLIALFFATRLINILDLPVTVDEGNYIVWAKQGLLNNDWFITLTDGKPPIPTWIAMFFISYTPDNMLLGLRLFSVFSGLLALTGFFILNLQLFDKKTAYIGSFLFILTPFLLFYDRMGQVDALTNASSLFIMIGSFLLLRKLTWLNVLLFSVICGLSLLIKQNVWINIILAAIVPITLYSSKISIKKLYPNMLRFLFLFTVSVVIGYIMYQLVMFSHFTEANAMVKFRNLSFFYSQQDLSTNLLNIFTILMPERLLSLLQMTGWIAIIFAVVGLLRLDKKNPMLALYFIIYFLPLFAVTLLLQHFFVRYVIFYATLLILLAGYCISTIKDGRWRISALGMVILAFSYFNIPMLFNYHKLDFPEFERYQYIEGIGSGYGIKEMADMIKEKSKEKQVLVIGEGGFGLGSNFIESAFPLYEKDVQFTGPWPLNKRVLEEHKPVLKDKYVFVMLNFQSVNNIPQDWPLKHIRSFKKPYDEPYLRLYELTE